MNNRMLAWPAFGIIAIALIAFSATAQEAQDARDAASSDEWVCPPCGARCHDDVYDAPGSCATCGMELVKSSTVPRVAVLVFDGVDLLAFSGPASVFARSDAAFVYTFADTTDPVHSQEVLAFAPKHDLQSAPAARVLVIVGGGGVTEVAGDSYITDRVKQRIDAADHVLCVGTGSIILHATGALEGKRVPLKGFIARNAERFLPGVVPDTEHRIIEHGKIVLAVDEAAALEASVRILEEMTDRDTAMRTAETLGIDVPGDDGEDDEGDAS